MSETKKLWKATDADAEIRRMEDVLGLPHSQMRTRVSEFNSRIVELAAMVARFKPGATAPAVAGPSARPLPAPTAAPPANRIPAPTIAAAVSPRTTSPLASAGAPVLSRKVCIAVMCEVFMESPSLFRGVSDADFLEDVKVRCKVAHLTLPGEPVAQHNLFGMARIMRGQKQDRLNRILPPPKG